MIVPVTIDELKGMKEDVAVADSFFKECGLPGTFKFEAWLHNWTLILERNFGVMWKFVSANKTVGLLGAILSPDMNDGEMIATEAFWYVLPAYRKTLWSVKLLITFEVWAKEIGAKRIVMAHLCGSVPLQLASYYEKRGYRPVEVNYVKEL